MLVPRWLRRSHVAPSDPEVLSDLNQADQAEYEHSGEFVPGGLGAATDFVTPGEESAAAYPDPVAWEDPAASAPAPESSFAASYSVTASYSAEVTYSTKTETADFGVPVGHTAPGAADDHWSEARGGGPGAHGGAPAAPGTPAAGHRYSQAPMRPPGPAPHILQARRRTLTMLIAITVAVMGTALIGLTPWWTSVPPFVLLGMYLMLLREVAHADAEHARSWAAAQARAAHAAHAAQLARERARQADVAPVPQPTAEIINLSALAAQADDQPYDQYADAEIRAVGD